MGDSQALLDELVSLGFTDGEMRRKLVKEGVSPERAAALVRKVSLENRWFRKGHLWKALSGVALVITVLAIVLLPSTGGRAATLGVVGSLTGGVVVFTTNRRGGDRSWMGMAAIMLGAFALFSGAMIDFDGGNVASAATRAPCIEAGGFCAEGCGDVLLEQEGLCPGSLVCCLEEEGSVGSQ